MLAFSRNKGDIFLAAISKRKKILRLDATFGQHLLVRLPDTTDTLTFSKSETSLNLKFSHIGKCVVVVGSNHDERRSPLPIVLI